MVKKMNGFFITCILLLSFLIACPSPNEIFSGSPPSDKTENIIQTGSITIHVLKDQSRSFLPEIDMNPASFEISGNGPMNNQINKLFTEGEVLLPELMVGEWTFTVYARNTDERIIGEGSITIRVIAGETVFASIRISPIEGIGNFNLEVSWPSQDVANPILISELHPASGPVIKSEIKISNDNDFSIARATYEDLPNGYYTLRIKLYDGELLKIGAMEVVCIIAGQQTSGSILFKDLSVNAGSVIVNIDVQLNDPIDVSLSPSSMRLQSGKELKLNPIVAQDSGNILYTWYVNGEQIDTQIDDYYIFHATNLGLYRVDVLCYLADGSRAGSASALITVTEALPVEEDDWTIMIYLDGDNNLEGLAINNFNMLESVNLENKKINIIVLFDRINGYNFSNGDWTGTRLYKVDYDSDDEILHSTQLSGMGLTLDSEKELNMGDKNTLNHFVEFCQSEYPASNYALILYNHGDGWYSKVPVNSDSKAVCFDSTNSNDSLSVRDLKEVLLDKNLKVIGFDACLMAMVEVAYELKDCADIMIASEQVIPNPGWNYQELLKQFISSDKTPEDFAFAAVEPFCELHNYRDSTLSAIWLDQMDNLVSAINFFADNLVKGDLDSVRTARDSSQYYDSSTSIDLYDFADHMACCGSEEVKSALKNAVIVNNQSLIVGNGLCIFFPKFSDNIQYPAYNTSIIDFPGNSSWDEFLAAFVDLAVNADIYEPDNTISEASQIEIGELQNHNYHSSSDIDYFKFNAIVDHRYTIETQYHTDDIDVTISIYDEGQTTLLSSIADEDSIGFSNLPSNSLISESWGITSQYNHSWTCSADGTYYFSVQGINGKLGEYSISLKDTTPGIAEPVEWCGISWIPSTLGKWTIQGDEFVVTGVNIIDEKYSYAETENKYTNFKFTVDVMKSGGFAFLESGIIFRKNGENFYLFYITGYQGHFSVVKYTDGKISEYLVDTVNPEAIIPNLMSWNTISVEAAGSEFKFYANDILLATIEDSNYSYGTVGLFAYDILDSVDHFKNALISGNPNEPPVTPTSIDLGAYGTKIIQDIILVISKPELPMGIDFTQSELGYAYYQFTGYNYISDIPEAKIQGEILVSDLAFIVAFNLANDPQGVESIVLGFDNILLINGDSYPVAEDSFIFP